MANTDKQTTTLNTPILAINRANIDDVVKEIEVSGDYKVKTQAAAQKYDIFATLGGKDVNLVNIIPKGQKYMAVFGVIPSRDFESDEETRKQAEVMVDYLKQVFRHYK